MTIGAAAGDVQPVRDVALALVAVERREAGAAQHRCFQPPAAASAAVGRRLRRQQHLQQRPAVAIERRQADDVVRRDRGQQLRLVDRSRTAPDRCRASAHRTLVTARLGSGLPRARRTVARRRGADGSQVLQQPPIEFLGRQQAVGDVAPSWCAGRCGPSVRHNVDLPVPRSPVSNRMGACRARPADSPPAPSRARGCGSDTWRLASG